MTGPSTLITGAAGFAGRHLLAHLRTSHPDHQLWAWSRRPQSAADDAVHWRQVDITDRTAVTQAMIDSRPDRIVHLAGAAHVGESWRNTLLPLKTNVMGTHHLLEAVRVHHPACRVLVVTSATIYRAAGTPMDEAAPVEPSSPYGFSKLAQDQRALAAASEDDLDIVVARPFNHVGPGQSPDFALSSFARQIALIEAGRAPAVLHVGNLDAERDLTDVRDVVDAYARLLDAGTAGRPYNICSGTAYRIGDLLDLLMGMAAVPIARAVDTARLRPSDVPRLVGNNSRMRTELGWMPRRPIAETLRDILQGWRSEVAAGRVIP